MQKHRRASSATPGRSQIPDVGGCIARRFVGFIAALRV
jgi:hypothetical protein